MGRRPFGRHGLGIPCHENGYIVALVCQASTRRCRPRAIKPDPIPKVFRPSISGLAVCSPAFRRRRKTEDGGVEGSGESEPSSSVHPDPFLFRLKAGLRALAHECLGGFRGVLVCRFAQIFQGSSGCARKYSSSAVRESRSVHWRLAEGAARMPARTGRRRPPDWAS